MKYNLDVFQLVGRFSSVLHECISIQGSICPLSALNFAQLHNFILPTGSSSLQSRWIFIDIICTVPDEVTELKPVLPNFNKLIKGQRKEKHTIQPVQHICDCDSGTDVQLQLAFSASVTVIVGI